MATKFNWFLNTNFVGDMSLSERITALEWQEDVVVEIVNNLSAGLNLQSMVNDIKNYTTQEDLPSYMRSIAVQARKVINDESDYPAFVKNLMTVKEDLLARLAADETSASAKLSKSYLSVIKAAENLSDSGLDAAIERAIDGKAAYNAYRIAQNETNRAYNQSVFQRAIDDEDCIGMRVSVSSGNVCDECTEISEDIYDIGSVPQTPIHVGCNCYLVPVYRTEEDIVDDYEGDTMQDYGDSDA